MKSANSLKPLLRVVGVTKRFGGLTAVDGVTFDVTPQEIVALPERRREDNAVFSHFGLSGGRRGQCL